MCDVYDEAYVSWGTYNYKESISIKDEEHLKKESLFREIQGNVRSKIDGIYLSNMKTNDGKTQEPERYSIKLIKNVFNGMDLEYECAGSQQPKDFRNVHKQGSNIMINIEIKKTDGLTVCFNDTCPSIDIFYIIIFTGKTFKRKADIPPQIIFINGYELLKDDEDLISMYKVDIEYQKNKWGRKKMGSYAKDFKRISVYPRPNYFADISDLLG